jgi:hypothetical protein
MVFTTAYGTTINQRISTAMKLAREMQIGLLRSASLDQIQALQAQQILTANIWHHPNEGHLTALY